MKNVLITLALFALSANAVESKPAYYNPLAKTVAVKFAPGEITTEGYEINAVFNKRGDNVLYARCSNDFSHCTLVESQYANGKWQAPKQLPFSGQYLDADPYYNEDYSAIYFVSRRPITEGGEMTENVNLWRVAIKDGEWQAPEYLENLNSPAHDLYPSITDNGDLYYPSFRDNKRQLLVAKKQGNTFAKPTALPSAMFGENGQIGDSVVLRDGKTIIFSMRRDDSLGKGDLYISTLENGQWSVAKHLGDKVNTPDHEFTPIVSPDGQYLFFTRIENGVGNIYQIALSALL